MNTATLNIGLSAIKNTVTSLLKYTERKKERIDYILDPLQAIYTLALFSYYPVGSKISIQNNILCIQPPNYSQGAIRWLQSDSKEDIFHLFHACKRFTIFYGFLKKYRVDDTNLYDLLVSYSKKGLTKLSETYGDVDKISLLHTIQLYKNILDNPDYMGMKDTDEIITNTSTSSTSSNTSSSSQTKRNIDDFFVEIKDLYTKEHFWIMTNILKIIERNEYNNEVLFTTIQGYETIMKTKFDEIKKWIHNNLVF